MIITYQKQKSVFNEIELLLKDVPEEKKKIEFIKACKRYYNIPEDGKIDNDLSIFHHYLGTMAFAGIVTIDNDFYYFDGNTIQPIILLQDQKELGILETYLGETIENTSIKTIHMYRMLENKPRKLEFENEQMLTIFEEELKQKLPDSAFISFIDKQQKEINMFEIPKQIELVQNFPIREYEPNFFHHVLGGVKVKFIHLDGTCTFLHIPNTTPLLMQEDIELKKANLSVLKELINPDHFYLEDAIDADIVIMEENQHQERIIDFLMAYLPYTKDEKISERTANQELLHSFNLSSYTSILTYGQHVQQEVTQKLNELERKLIDSTEVERISVTLKRLDNTVEHTNENVKPRKEKNFFQKLFERKKDEAYDNSNLENQMQTIEQIKEELSISAQNILDSISNCKLVQNITLEYIEKLNRYIQVANNKLEEMKLQHSTNVETMNMLKRKIESLEISQVLAKQTYSQFSMLTKTKAHLFEKVCTATQLIPILTSQSILKRNIDSQNDILNLNQNMYQYTQDTITNNSNALKQTVHHTLSQKDSIEILKAVIESVDELAEATKNGLTPASNVSYLSIEPKNKERLEYNSANTQADILK